MKMRLCVLAAISACLVSAESAYDAVDPFWGTGAVANPVSEGMARGWSWEKAQSGNTHPGACSPFGWVSACAYSGAYPSGYGRVCTSWDGPAPVIGDRNYAWGITHFHHSGTGWISKFYNYFLFTPYAEGANLGEHSRLDAETARPGYYAGVLTDYGTSFELTVGRYAACHRYRFNSGGGRLRLNLRQGGLKTLYVHGAYPPYKTECPQAYEATKSESGVWSGRVRFHGVDIYFSVCFKGTVESSSYNDGMLDFRFGDAYVEAYAGFSLVGANEAASRAKSARDLGFDGVESATRTEWERQLSRIEVDFGDAGFRPLFYSTLYHSLLKPVDCGGGYIDFSTFWDVYRTQLPLVLSFDTVAAKGICEHIIATVERKGFSPICQIMDDAVVHKDMQATALPVYTLTDAFFRGVFSKDDYFRLKGVFVREFAHADISGMSPTHALDLSGAYRAAAYVAERCDDISYAGELKAKAAVWKKAYDVKTALLHSNTNYYEGNHWNYSFRPHPSMMERVSMAGGPDGYLALLDRFFCRGQAFPEWTPAKDRVRKLGSFEGLNNETDMDTPYAYVWCGKPDRTAEVVDLVRRCRFSAGEGGCPGNNDSGATSSWYVWNSLGIYPLTGTPYYLLGTPSVASAEMRFVRGKLKISVERESTRSIYPAGYVFNGRAFLSPWIAVEELECGGELKFKLSDRPAAVRAPIPDWL
ncbi:MAG: glycoside hydrolase family 92 protein [Kiritimatiellae bacterium]|nr:glycoside hydrolase family 92 protein [Kiritimatiellia bacterium]